MYMMYILLQIYIYIYYVYIYTVLIVYIYSLHNCGKRALYHQCADKQALWIWIYHMMDYP